MNWKTATAIAAATTGLIAALANFTNILSYLKDEAPQAPTASEQNSNSIDINNSNIDNSIINQGRSSNVESNTQSNNSSLDNNKMYNTQRNNQHSK